MSIYEREASERIIKIARTMRPYPVRHDLLSAIRHCAANPEKPLDGYEGERHQQLRREHAKHLPTNTGSGFFIDGSDLQGLLETRAEIVGAGASGGYLVETEMAPNYIELARARSVIGTLGATFLGDLIGPVSFGRVSGSSIAVTWSQTETSTPSDGTQTFSQVTMSPKQVAVVLRESRQLLLQTSLAAQWCVAWDLLAAISQGADIAALSGSAGSGAPVGILDMPGVSSISGASATNATVITLQADTAKRLSPAAGYVAPVATAQALSGRLRDSSNTAFYVWEDGLYNGRVAGCRAIASDNVPASTLIFGNWDQLLVGTWGPIFLEVSPFGLSASDFQTGTIALRAILLMDVAVRDPLAFAVATGVT